MAAQDASACETALVRLCLPNRSLDLLAAEVG